MKSAMSSSSLLSTLIFIHRDLGSNDESALDTEQADKILYYYPESTPIGIQLARCNMIEGIIDFFTRFTYEDDSIDNVLMDNQIWCFVRIDDHPSIWLIAAVPSESSPGTDTLKTDQQTSSFSSYIHSNISLSSVCPSTSLLSSTDNVSPIRLDSQGLRITLIRFYDLYSLFHPTIANTIHKVDPGLSTVKYVQQLRKLSRKLFDRLQQVYADMESIKSSQQQQQQIKANLSTDDSESVSNRVSSLSVNDDYRPSNISISEQVVRIADKSLSEYEEEVLGIKKDITKYSLELENLIHDTSKYLPAVLTKFIVPFMKWFLSSGEILFSSALHSMTGVQMMSVGQLGYQPLIRVQQAIDECSKQLCKGRSHSFPYDATVLNLTMRQDR
jgi:hypothetical protein